MEICRYSEFRNPPWSDRPYKRPLVYWQILAARLIFLVLFQVIFKIRFQSILCNFKSVTFQNVVGFIQMVIAWGIPDVPGKLRDQIRREEYLTREVIIRKETMRNNGCFIPTISSVSQQTNPLDGDSNFRKRKVNGDIESTTL